MLDVQNIEVTRRSPDVYLRDCITKTVDLVGEGLGDEIERDWIGGTFILGHRGNPFAQTRVAGLNTGRAEE